MARTVLRAAGLTLVGLVGLILVIAASGFGYRQWRHHQIAAATPVDRTRGIDEGAYVRIGGVEQWIGIRGRDRNNPVILLLHGGPGLATSPYPRDFLYDWTGPFTLVQWDQRGAGRTYGRSGPVGRDVTIERMAQDGLEVADYLRRKLHKPRIIIVGHSWGTVLGVRMALARPDLFYAYVGTGQGVNVAKYRPLGYRLLLDQARARNDRKTLRALQALGPPPYGSTDKEAAFTNLANAYDPGGLSGPKLLSTIAFDSDADLSDLRAYANGVASSSDHFRAALGATDVADLGMDFRVPVFVFQGALDPITPAEPVRAYVAGITAPQKELVIIPNAGHEVMSDRNSAFLQLLVSKVRPLAADPSPPSPLLATAAGR